MYLNFNLINKLLKSPYFKDYNPINLPFLVSPQTTEKLIPIEIEIQTDESGTQDYCFNPEIALVDHLETKNFLKNYDEDKVYFSIVPCLNPSKDLAVQHFLVVFSKSRYLGSLADDLLYTLRGIFSNHFIMSVIGEDLWSLENDNEETIAIFTKGNGYNYGLFNLGIEL